MNVSNKHTQRIARVASALLATTLIIGTSVQANTLPQERYQNASNQSMTTLSTIAGNGEFKFDNGLNRMAKFRSPSGIVLMADGSIVVTDTRNHVIRKIKDGETTTLAGVTIKKDAKGFPIGAFFDGSAETSFFQEPQGMAVDSQGNIYVADSANHAIRKIDGQGNVTTFSGTGVLGNKDGNRYSATFQRPTGLAIGPDDTVYVADTLNHLIRAISPTGEVYTLNAPSTRTVEVTPGQVLLGGEYADGLLSTAKFNEPTRLAFDQLGNLYVSDTGNHLIRYIDLKEKTVTTVAGSRPSGELYEKNELYAQGGFTDGAALTATFNAPQGIATTKDNALVIADSQNHSIRYLKDGVVSTLAGSPIQRAGDLDGIEGVGLLKNPLDVAITADGVILVVDSFNNRIRSLQLQTIPAKPAVSEGEAQPIRVLYNGSWIPFDAQPEIRNERTMVPLRLIAEALGYEVRFEESTQTIQMKNANTSIELGLDRTGLKRMVTGSAPILRDTDVAPYLREERTFVPLRFFAEEIGLDVQWIVQADGPVVILRNKSALR